MKITNGLKDMLAVYENGEFNLKKWCNYIETVYNGLGKLCLDDMQQTLATGLVDFENDYMPILNAVYERQHLIITAVRTFNEVTERLENRITTCFGKSLEVELILYLGLCNGAGWVTETEGKTVCLIGIEKLLELNWYDEKSLIGLIFHELGHVYQNQYGTLERKIKNNRSKFLWQLFTEGVAMVFEQTLVGDENYFHQDENGWKEWCDERFSQIKKDFDDDLKTMDFENQRYFGDWVTYNGHPDVGYYLGAKFVRFICENRSFDSVLSLSVKEVCSQYSKFLRE